MTNWAHHDRLWRFNDLFWCNLFGVIMDNNVWIVLAILAIIVGFFVLGRIVWRAMKSKGSLAVLGDVNHKNGLPITPRDERSRPTFDSVPVPHEEDVPDALTSMAAVAASSPVVSERAPQVVSAPAPVRSEPAFEPDAGDIMTHEEDEAMRKLNHSFEQNSPLLDKHLSDQETFDQDNSPLLNAQDTITVMITPRNQFAGLSGKTVLGIVREYGLKYGVMNMFHRYEHENGMGDLWFSMLGANDEGVQPFDLNELAEGHFNGLVLFLSLPHPHALRGFDSMVSVAQMIASDLDANLYDENGQPLDDAQFARMRAIASDYQ